MKEVILDNIKSLSISARESLRALRTNVQFCGDDVKVILVTSSMPDEGKSTVAMNLARSLSEIGKRVLFIDTDMRKSVMVARLRAHTADKKVMYGLSHYLSGQRKLDSILYQTNIERLDMIFSGPAVPNPTEILEKSYMADLISYAREHYDYVLLDCAPLTAAIDAAVIAKHCDGVVLVIAQGVATRRTINSVVRQLESSGTRILGAVFNKVDTHKTGYGKYYGNYYGNYSGNGDDVASEE